MATPKPYRLELAPREAFLMWKMVVSAKAKVVKGEFEKMDTYGPETSTRLREAADRLDYLGELAVELAVYCRENGYEVGFGR